MEADTARFEADAIEGVPAPQSQPRLVGHMPVWDELVARLNNARLPSGLLLHGPKGIGKATLAFAFARHILTATGDEPAKLVIAQVASGGHPNLAVLRLRPRENNSGFYTEIRVGDVRKLIHDLHQTRGRAGYRVCIIDSVDDCNRSSANVLLKILEEPPPEVLFILVSHRPGGLLPTIRSRCQAYAMRPLAEAAVTDIVTTTAPDTAPAALEHALRLASGRPRRAFEALVLGDDEALDGLANWLKTPGTHPVSVHLDLAGALAGPRAGARTAFARDLIRNWLSAESRAAALSEPGTRARLASATQLWEKAQVLFAEANTYNLDQKQTLIALFDAIRQHAQHFIATPVETS